MSQKDSQSQHQTSLPSETWNKFLLRIKYSFYSAVVFFLMANPETFRILQTFVKNQIQYTDTAGVPTATGFFIQTGLFFMVMLGLMLIPNL